ncbi:MAG: hypothetical protein GYA17_21590, partial [Chloroflexi bacterium]|nr:hypothetical protein [Chloroflexota bacterium]
PVPMHDMVYVSDRPSLKPLTDLLDNYGGYGVVLVDKQGARLFYFHLGELKEQEGILGEMVKHTKRGGSSSFPGRRGGASGQTRYAEETVDRNIKEVADFAVRFFEAKHVRRVLIGGTDDNVSLLRGQLPKAWQSLISGTFPMNMTASHAEVMNKAVQIGTESERKREERLVENMITAAAKASNAVVGIQDTLDGINNSRVQTLFLTEGFHLNGFRCHACNWLTTDSQECPNCQAPAEAVDDVVEAAIYQVMRNGGEVEVVHDSASLARAGDIGALLRY